MFGYDERFEFADPEREAYEDEIGAAFGDARRCPHHPEVKTSSDDGMFDAPCGKCEASGDEYAYYLEAKEARPVSCSDNFHLSWEVKVCTTWQVNYHGCYVSAAECEKDNEIPF